MTDRRKRATTPGVAPPAKAPILILCGFMGTGKTATGRVLASMLAVPFVDTDDVVEAQAGSSVMEIFARDGEARFRELEMQAVTSIASESRFRQGAVVATGGGTLLREEAFQALAAMGTMIVLDAALDAIAGRTVESHDRPRLPRTTSGAVDDEAVRALYESRRAVYERIGWRIDTTTRTPLETAFEIAEKLRHDRKILHVRVDTRPIPGHTPRPGEARLSRVVVGRGALASLGSWVREVGIAGPAFVISSRRVASFHGVKVRAALDAAGVKSRFIEVDDSESGKSFDQAERLLYELVDAGATRDSAVIALGGGVTGDLAGFVAATYMRGLPFVQVPTTLLAQVDASIGGKVGVNHPRFKNLIGAVHQPHLVLSDLDTLTTLPPRELAGGMAEVVKTAIIGSPGFFATMHAASVALGDTAASGKHLQDDATLLETAVWECARVKARIVEQDPYENDRRRVLNLGHTLAHAIESVSGYDTVGHGEAVALGLLAAVRVATRQGVATRDFLESVRTILAACALPTAMPPIDATALAQAMSGDKKRRHGGLTFVLPVAPGDVRIVGDVTEDEVIAAAQA